MYNTQFYTYLNTKPA